MADDFMNGFLAGQGDNNRGGLFGGDGWWAIIIFALIFGWGNGGYGFGGNSGGVADGYVLASDFANVERKIDAVNNGVCDGFYAMNTGMLNGFAGVTQAVTSGFSAAELARCNQQAALMQQLNAMQMQVRTAAARIGRLSHRFAMTWRRRRAIPGTRSRMVARDITDNQNAGTRAILDFLTQSKIQTLEADNQALRLAASQSAQNATLINALRPSPIPSYSVANPYCCNTNTCSGCGY